MIHNFLSNKWNLYGVYAITYLLIGFIFEVTHMTFIQMFIAFFLIILGNFVTYVYGMSRGVMIVTTTRPKFIKELDKINELVREENNDTSKPKCTKCSRKDGTCGCGKGKKIKKDKGCSSGGCDKC